MLIDVSESRKSPAVLKVIGLGGGGGNAVNRMLASEIRGVEFLVANTDVQALEGSLCMQRLQIGAEVTHGLGSGGRPALGRAAAEEDLEALSRHLSDADMVFIAAGMGGGTGTGASPVVARAAREQGALTVAIVTKPFGFEGRLRQRQAEAGIEELRQEVDTLIVIPNQRLLHVVDKATPLNDALRVADDVLTHATKGISEIITVRGLINVDFADVRSIMQGMGNALMGMGFGRGPDRARQAADMAICSPLLEDISIAGAQGILVNFTGGEDLTLAEVDEAATLIVDAAGADANVIVGAVIDPSLTDEIRVTLIATGFGEAARGAVKPAEPQREPYRLRDAEDSRPAIPLHAAAVASERMVVGAGAEPAAEPLGVAGPSAVPRRPIFGGRPPAELGDGILGPARPIRREMAPEPAGAPGRMAPAAGLPQRSQPVAAAMAPPVVAAAPLVAPADLEISTAPAPEAPQPAFSEARLSDPLPAPADPEPTQPIVPLVWKQNPQAGRWAPKAASRWQRVLQREQADVPSFLRKRQKD